MERGKYDEKLEEQIHEQFKIKLAEHDLKLEAHNTDIKDLQIVSSARTKEFAGIEKSVDKLSKQLEEILKQNRNMMITIITILLGVLVFVYEKHL